MKKITLSTLLCFSLFFVSCFSYKAIAAPGDSAINLLLAKVPGWMAEHHVPVTGVGVIEEGKLKWVHVFGVLQTGKPAPENTLFNIASQTKPVTAMLVLKLVQTGSWNLDEPLDHYWTDPDLAGDSNLRKLTTRLVLSHQSGFPNWRNDNGGTRLRFLFAPGSRTSYSGEGFEYLRRAVEKKFGRTLDKLMDSLLWKPAGMNATQYWTKNLDSNRFAHWFDGEGRPYGVSMQTPVSAADDLITTVADYCRFGIYTMNGAGLSDALFADAVRPQRPTTESRFNGLGWGIVSGLPGGEYALQHGGSDIGVRTMAIFLPKSKSGIVVLTDADNGMFVYEQIIRTALPLGAAVLDSMNKPAHNHDRITISEKTIEKYTGTYLQANGKKLFVVREGNAIKVSGDGAPTAVLVPESETRFFLPDHDVQIEFIQPASGSGMTLSIVESGRQVMKIERTETGTPK